MTSTSVSEAAAASNDDDGCVVLRFVLPKGKNETTCSDELLEAFEKCKDNEMGPVWITNGDVMKLEPTKTVRNKREFMENNSKTGKARTLKNGKNIEF